MNFENLIVQLHVLYILNTCIIFYDKNLKFKHVIDDIVINL